MLNFFELKRVIDKDDLSSEDLSEMDYGGYKRAGKSQQAPPARKMAIARTATPPAAAAVETPPAAVAAPATKTRIARKPMPTDPVPTVGGEELTTPTLGEKPAGGKQILTRTEPKPQVKDPSDPIESKVKRRQTTRSMGEIGGKDAERFREDKLAKLNGLIKGTGTTRFYAIKALQKAGVPFDENKPFLIAGSEDSISDDMLQYKSPFTRGNVEVAQKIVIEDPKVLNAVIRSALKRRNDAPEAEQQAQDVAFIKTTLAKMPKTPAVAKAIRFEEFLNINHLAGISMTVRKLSEALSKKDSIGGVDENPEESLEATKVLLGIATKINYPWVHAKGDVNDENTVVTLDSIPELNKSEIEELGLRYPTVDWLNKQSLKRAKAAGEEMYRGVPVGSGQTAATQRPEMSTQERIGSQIDDLAKGLDQELLGDLETSAPQTYNAILNNIFNAKDLDETLANQLMQKLDGVRDQLWARWQIDDFNPDRVREQNEWGNYNALLEYYMS